jgi:hypothetical protein
MKNKLKSAVISIASPFRIGNGYMNKMSTALRVLAVLFVGLNIEACKKSDNPNAPATTTSTITFINDTFTPVNITFNGFTATISQNGNAVFTGTAGQTATGSATTYGSTTSGSQLGATVSFQLSVKFPTAGTNVNYPLDVPNTYFYLKVVNNNANYNIRTIITNSGYSGTLTDNVNIPNDGQTYLIGYYPVYANSNVNLYATLYLQVWSFTNLSFPNTINQSKTLTAN